MTANEDFAGMVAIVTGASRGLGRAFARELVSSGASVTITARSVDGLHETASLPATGQGHSRSFLAMSRTRPWRLWPSLAPRTGLVPSTCW